MTTGNDHHAAWAAQFHSWIYKYGKRVCEHCGEVWTAKYDQGRCKVSIGKAKAGRKV